jgi:aspartyl-tRNA synthetase
MFRTHYIKDAKGSVGKEVQVAGWVHEIRDLGKLIFIQLRDRTGIVQVTAKKGVVPDEVMTTLKRNKEDVVSVTGTVKENKIAPDGVEISPSKAELLSFVGIKLPVDPTGLVPSDLDIRLNYRYLDLRKKDVTGVFSIKSEIAKSFRERCTQLGFMEIHPTSIVAAATEGGTEVFAVEYFEQKVFLAQSPQLYKQMAVVGGLDKVMMTMPVFRAEKHHTTTHLNEVIQMDIEMGFADDNDAMGVLSDVTLHMLKNVEKMKDELALLNPEFVAPKEVPRHTYTELVDLLGENNMKMEWGEDFSKEAEKKLGEILQEDLFLIYEWPTNVRAFYSMPKEGKEDVCKAFDLIYKGLEISSGAQRIHIPELLEKQLEKRGLNPRNFDFYIDAFRVGAPPHAGWSIGLERLTMKVTNRENIRECMLFPRDRTRVHP